MNKIEILDWCLNNSILPNDIKYTIEMEVTKEEVNYFLDNLKLKRDLIDQRYNLFHLYFDNNYWILRNKSRNKVLLEKADLFL